MTSGRLVMIVEDEPLIRGLCADVFREADFDVIEVASGDEALAYLECEGPVTAIVSDVRMPGNVDGLALRDRVLVRWPVIKILLTSGHILLDPDGDCKGKAFLPKPYRFLELVRTVEDLIRDN